jgi:cell division septation protein DedD
VKGNERQTAAASTKQSAAGKVPLQAAGYSVQVGSFRSRNQAESLLHRLAQKGYRVAIQPATIPGQGVWYRVQVGGFPERGAADRLAQQLVTQERVAGVVVDGAR